MLKNSLRRILFCTKIFRIVETQNKRQNVSHLRRLCYENLNRIERSCKSGHWSQLEDNSLPLYETCLLGEIFFYRKNVLELKNA